MWLLPVLEQDLLQLFGQHRPLVLERREQVLVRPCVESKVYDPEDPDATL